MAARLTPLPPLASQKDEVSQYFDVAPEKGNGTTWCRSPQLYHRQGTSLLSSQARGDREGQSMGQKSDLSGASTSSESGTEADDERGRLLKGLPAPPRRPHKGLRDAPFEDPTPQPSSLGTPLPLDSSDRQFKWPTSKKIAANLVDGAVEVQHIREKYTRRKRLELVRRITETVLFFTVGFVVSCGHLSEPWLLDCKPVIVNGFVLVLLLYTSYPIRAAVQAKKAGRTLTASINRGFHIPSRFDVAPLLYPVFLPLLVSLSLRSGLSDFVVPNVVLGVSSLAPEILSAPHDPSGLNTLHWFLTLLPFAFQDSPKPADMMTLLFPLHVYTVLTLQFLTTTSLDVTEIRLLGTILVDLWVFASHPQSEILKALLWLGSILIFVICKQPLQWELALARIPAWRLREGSRRPRSSASVLQRLDRAACEAVIGLASGPEVKHIEDEEDERKLRPLSELRKITSTFPTAVNGVINQSMPNSLDRSCTSAIRPRGKPPNTGLDDCDIVDAASMPQRRHTLSLAGPRVKENRRTTPSGRPKRSLTPSSQSFLALSPVQITVRKSGYAAFVYLAMLFIILGPVRIYIRLFSVNGVDPFGWALGYLLGDIYQVRIWVLSAGLSDWIPMPNHSGLMDLDHVGWIDRSRRDILGAGNVRLMICIYCLIILLVGLATVNKLSSTAEIDTRRKVFHGIMVAMLLPSIYIDPCFISLALIVILAVFLLLDLIRASQLPPISKPLTIFLAPYVDGRDHRGPVIVSPIFLLIGCAIPLWLSLAAVPRTGDDAWNGWEVTIRDVSMVSGVICVGMGDSAASLIGRRYGRHKWYWAGEKSLEGSVAFAVAVTAGLTMAYIWLQVGGWKSDANNSPATVLAKAGLAASGASLTEAVLTGANDNVVVPVVLWLLVRGLRL